MTARFRHGERPDPAGTTTRTTDGVPEELR